MRNNISTKYVYVREEILFDVEYIGKMWIVNI